MKPGKFMKLLFFLTLAIVIGFSLTNLTGCGGSSGGSSNNDDNNNGDDNNGVPAATITDSDGNTVSSLPAGRAALISLENMTPNTQYDIHVSMNGTEVGYYRLTTDANGDIPLTAIGYDLSSGSYSYTVTEVTEGRAEGDPDLEGNYSVSAATRNLEIKDDAGTLARTFFVADSVYVTGSGFPADTEVDLYVVNDQLTWSDGDQLNDVSANSVSQSISGLYLDLIGTAERIITDANGNIASTAVWIIPNGINGGTPLDVVVDVNQNGLFDVGTDYANGSFGVGFVVQSGTRRAPGADFSADLACDFNRNYRNTFMSTENVYVFINPETEMQLGGDHYVKKYVVTHKDSWTDGEALVDVSGPNSSNWWDADTVQSGCTNEGRVLVWPAPLRAGSYDVVIDVNRNDVYDEGVDILDGSGTTPGFIVIDQEASESKDWTVMVYINGDNNLEEPGVDDINEMEQVGSSDDVNIVVQFDRISDYDTSNGDWETARRYYITQDNDTSTIGSTMIADIGEPDMGNAQTLTEFAVWAMANYPADHYMLVVWDHGGGFRHMDPRGLVRDISWDDTSGGTSISIPQLAASLQAIKAFNGGANIDIVGMDACLMAMAEVAYEVRESADYMVASEETEPGDGWPYDLFLARLVAAPTSTPAELADWIVQDYITSYGSTAVTQSAIDLGTMDALASSIDTFADAMIAGIGGDNGSAIKTALQNHVGNSLAFEVVDYHDLYHFAELVAADTGTMTADIISAGTAVMSAVTTAVTENGTVGAGFANAYGLSIWLPEADVFNNHILKYSQMTFAGDTSWDEFLSVLWGVKMRIELTWGAVPKDIDSHLRDIFGNEVRWNHKTIAGAWLDLDDTTSYGPENIRIEAFGQPDGSETYNSYLYAVYNWSRTESSENIFVKVFEGGDTVPSVTYTKAGFDSTNLWWNVFEVNPATEVITEINTVQSSAPAGMASREALPEKKDEVINK